ncbi:TonB-dependent siderophore receptor [Flavobacterium agricola]|uniref:TonB-dependent siderophore receptor n=1 Tax=Flavobacterium agricola TaxID=2870839 RepID=A0ABY6LXS5_9FLAO|nr:TonB-dependent siderophore receptor [Flavobacterium agricola]UYW01132.1 TonB-dependent siderophore receptor [Flavobacterium agricola]
MKGFIISSLILSSSFIATAQVSTDTLNKKTELDEIEVFGERNRKPKGLEAITRMPLKPSDQIQSISIISHKVIEAQGALTITEAIRNVPGVTLFGSYGGVKESMSTRGFRGVPVLKNGVRIESQFQTAGGVIDMQGVESIQVIKGSAAITQGVITDLGNAGGVINVVTKTPNFYNRANVGVRVGSWNQFRPTFDVEQVLNESQTLSVRVNGAYESADSYRKDITSNRVYFNPSIAFQASPRTRIIVEGDYLNSNVTPHTSAVNLAANQGTNALYVLPHNKFLGLRSDNNNTVSKSVMARVDHEINDIFSLRGAYASNSMDVDNMATSTTPVNRNQDFNIRNRTIARSYKEDSNKTLQFDLIGQNLYTGKIKHIGQIGFDYRSSNVNTTNFDSYVNGVKTNKIDEINIYDNIPNNLNDMTYTDANGAVNPYKVSFQESGNVIASYNTFGILFQDVIEFNKYLKATLGLRYSVINTEDRTGVSGRRESAWNPSVGVIVTPFKNFNVFGSYTNSTSLRSASNLMANGEKIGPSTTNQFETGIKSDWLDNKLRFNFTYFHINTANLSNSEYLPGSSVTTGYYFKAGDLVRDGIETEINGRITNDITVMFGYAWLDARYKNSPSYVNGSAPMNAPEHTANFWAQYKFSKTALKGLSVSAGLYYVGDRPVNEYSLAPDGHGNYGGIAPFNMPSYTTLNFQVGYTYKKMEARVFLNNVTDQVGLNSYFRGGYINQIDPFNMAVALNYRF